MVDFVDWEDFRAWLSRTHMESYVPKLVRTPWKYCFVLKEPSKPSVNIHKRFGKEITVNYYPNELNRECSLVKEMQIVEGAVRDWRKLAGFHYRSHR